MVSEWHWASHSNWSGTCLKFEKKRPVALRDQWWVPEEPVAFVGWPQAKPRTSWSYGDYGDPRYVHVHIYLGHGVAV